MASHRGEILKRVLEGQGVTVTWLANKMGKTARSFYNWFENPDLSLDKFLEIGKIIHYDFSSEIPEIPVSTASEPEVIYSSGKKMTGEECLQRFSMLWDKYTKLLEDYKDLSDKHLSLQNRYK